MNDHTRTFRTALQGPAPQPDARHADHAGHRHRRRRRHRHDGDRGRVFVLDPEDHRQHGRQHAADHARHHDQRRGQLRDRRHGHADAAGLRGHRRASARPSGGRPHRPGPRAGRLRQPQLGARTRSSAPRRPSSTFATGRLADGEPFTDRDVLSANASACSARPSSASSSRTTRPIGKEIRVKNVSFRVVGVLAPQGRQHDGHGPGRHPARAVDDHQVPRHRLDAGEGNQSASSGSSSSVNTLSNCLQRPAHALPGAVRDADGGQPAARAVRQRGPVHGHGAERAARSPSAIQQITQVLRERHGLRRGAGRRLQRARHDRDEPTSSPRPRA